MNSHAQEAIGKPPPSFNDLQSEIYHALHPREIRLVKLLRGKWIDPIRCQLHHAALANGPKFKALSYVWGFPRVTRTILVNGRRHSVTFNLEAALRRLRRTDDELTIWVDALCINQSNNAERTEQVNLMHDIFALTEEVVVYLGELPLSGSMSLNESTTTFHNDDRDLEALDIFRRHCSSRRNSTVAKGKARIDYAFEIFCFLRLLNEDPDSTHLPCFDINTRQFIDSKYQQNLFEGLRQLIHRPWWNRIWVIQEVVVPQNVTVVYGSSVAPWHMFVNAALWDSRNRTSSAPLSFPREYSIVLAKCSRVILDIDRMRALLKRGQQTTLLQFVRRFSGRKASDDRDKVYALLSLAQQGTSIVPDYRLSVNAVFQNAVLDIIKTTKALTVFIGDLDRKDRQDLPSWVPDWSATSEDLDRRQAESMDIYSTTPSSLIYVQDEGAEEWSGGRQYLRSIGNLSSRGSQDSGEGVQYDETISRFTGDYLKTFNDILGTSDWYDWISRHGVQLHRAAVPSEETCLAAIDNYFTTCGGPICLKNHGSGIIGLAGLYMDKIALTGETPFSEEGLLSIIHSWVFLVHNHFSLKKYDKSGNFVGDTFRKTLCAGIIRTGSDIEGFTTRRIDTHDHGQIANWLLQRTEIEQSPFPPLQTTRLGYLTPWGCLFDDLGEWNDPDRPIEPISPSIDNAIRSATIRRTFFITEKGYIGLGPAKTRVGDHLFLLLGGQTPFILREAGPRRILRMPRQPRLGYVDRNCFELIGYSYTHGLMDGEGMREWRNITGKMKEDFTLTIVPELLSHWREFWERREKSRLDLSSWKHLTDEDALTRKIRTHNWRYRGQASFKLFMSEDELEKMVEVSGNAEYAEKAKSCTDDLSQWIHAFEAAQEKSWMAELVKAARLKAKGFEEDLAKSELELENIEVWIKSADQDLEHTGRVYLV